MKKFNLFLTLFLITFTFISCDPPIPTPQTSTGIEAFNVKNVDYYYNYAEICIPDGTKVVYLENYSGVDERGQKLNLTTSPITVKPISNYDENKIEPFSTVRLLLKSPYKTMASVYYSVPSELEEDSSHVSNIYVLHDFKINKIAYGEFGVTKYVQIANDYDNFLPEDIYVYNEEHNHTLHYIYGYAKLGNGEGYVLEDMYKVDPEHIIVKSLYDNYEMPWDIPGFVPSGNTLPTKAPMNRIALSEDENNITEIKLTEPAPYTTENEGHTYYHSSGCVMFEDSWPSINLGAAYDLDFNDCVVDYDIEARTVSDEQLEDEAWREQVKVVLHLRAVGSNIPYRTGVMLEGFDQNNVEYIEQHFTLDSYENPHGELPAFTIGTIQNMSNHYETDPLNPVIEMAHIFTLNQERAGVGENAIYTYTNGDFINQTVFNLTFGYKNEDPNQYDPELALITSPTTLKQIQSKKYYNAIPGYINVAGGLITYTVIYHMKNRSKMTPEQRELTKQNMIETVTNTKNQNFYIITNDFTPVGLKGYRPVFVHNQSINKYNSKFVSNINHLHSTIPYYGIDGYVWGIKCPTLTRHIWNKLYFSQAYPHYQEWVESNGESHQNWYDEDINELYLSCWW